MYSAFGVTNIVVVMNQKYCEDKWAEFLRNVSSKIILVRNADPDFGKFHSLKLGLGHITAKSFCFLQPVDQPFIDEDLLNALWANRNPTGFVSPVFEGRGGHPVLISESVIKSALVEKESDLNLKEFLCRFPKVDIKMNNNNVLKNINSPEDYMQISSYNIMA